MEIQNPFQLTEEFDLSRRSIYRSFQGRPWIPVVLISDSLMTLCYTITSVLEPIFRGIASLVRNPQQAPHSITVILWPIALIPLAIAEIALNILLLPAKGLFLILEPKKTGLALSQERFILSRIIDAFHIASTLHLEELEYLQSCPHNRLAKIQRCGILYYQVFHLMSKKYPDNSDQFFNPQRVFKLMHIGLEYENAHKSGAIRINSPIVRALDLLA